MVIATEGHDGAETPTGAQPRLLVIADLRHASPRWPALLGGLMLRGWDVTIITAPLGTDAAIHLGFPNVFSSRARIIETGAATDVLEPIRRFLWFVGLRRRVSLTEQVKGKLGHSGSRNRFDRLFQLGLALIGWPDLQAPWKKHALRAAENLLTTERFDALLSSSPYPTSHVVAAGIKRRHPALRWIADFRDLWAENHNYAMPKWRRTIDRYWERSVLRMADALTSPTQAWADQLSRTHSKPAAYVPNGFVDYEAALDTPPMPSGRFVLLYSGVRYPSRQIIVPLLEAISHLRDDGTIDASSFLLRWLGPFDSETSLEAERLGIESLLSQEPPVSREAAQRAQREAHALLFLQWQDPDTDWSSSLKLHEYIGSGRPILALGGHTESAVSQLLTRSGRAVLAFTVAQAEAALRGWISETRNNGAISIPSDWKNRAHNISGISRGLPELERILLARELRVALPAAAPSVPVTSGGH